MSAIVDNMIAYTQGTVDSINIMQAAMMNTVSYSLKSSLKYIPNAAAVHVL